MTLNELGKMVESCRFKMGINLHDFSKQIGMSTNTYLVFLKQSKKTQPRTVYSIVNFLEEQGIAVGDLELE